MNFLTTDDSTLIQNIEKLVRQEREILTNVLHHLREIERRRLFSALGYKSLFDFVVRYLGYPEDQAYRRISAMRLLKEIPELEIKLATGDISLTHIGLAQTLFKQELKFHKNDMSHTQKLAVFNQIANKPVREAQRITLAMSSAPEAFKPDRISQISKSRIELQFTASHELQQKIEKLKGLLAHKHPSLSLGQLFEKLCDLWLAEWDLAKTAAPRKRRVKTPPHLQFQSQSPPPELLPVSSIVKSQSQARSQSQSQSQIRKSVFLQGRGCCENCGSTYALEIDHITPKAKGGSSGPANLRLLCRNCNQRAAIQEFGMETMDNYIN